MRADQENKIYLYGTYSIPTVVSGFKKIFFGRQRIVGLV